MSKDYIWLMATGVSFVLGVAAGILVMRDRMEQKYQRIAQEEIDSVKEAFARRKREEDTRRKQEEEEAQVKEPPTPASPPDAARALNVYSGGKNGPHVIPPEEFGEKDGYDTITLVYFADGVLTDDDNHPVDDVGIVGEDSLTHFGEYEDDSVFVRNDGLKCDFEILYDMRRYSDVAMTMPPEG